VAISTPFAMVLNLGISLIMVTFYDDNIDNLPPIIRVIYEFVVAAKQIIKIKFDAILRNTKIRSASQASRTGEHYL
jgi:hypothetical protein